MSITILVLSATEQVFCPFINKIELIYVFSSNVFIKNTVLLLSLSFNPEYYTTFHD